jgi:type IX secretion system PorP/SprF family membrane protein
MKKTIIPCLIILFHLVNRTQAQTGWWSNYAQTPYIHNPAAGGVSEKNQVFTGYRSQWGGFAGAPKSYIVGGYYSLDVMPKLDSVQQASDSVLKAKGIHPKPQAIRNRHVLGGMLTADSYGIFNQYQLGASYAYQLPIDSKHRLVLGVMPTLLQSGVDRSQADGDRMVLNYTNKTLFNIHLGSWVYSQRYYGGLSVQNPIQNGIQPMTYMLTGGYYYTLYEDIQLIPSMIIRGNNAMTPIQTDINVTGSYRQMFQVGLGYRTNGSILMQVGINYKNWHLGYYSDINISHSSPLGKLNNEFWLGWKF